MLADFIFKFITFQKMQITENLNNSLFLIFNPVLFLIYSKIEKKLSEYLEYERTFLDANRPKTVVFIPQVLAFFNTSEKET